MDAIGNFCLWFSWLYRDFPILFPLGSETLKKKKPTWQKSYINPAVLFASKFFFSKTIFTLPYKHIQASEQEDKPNCALHIQLGKKLWFQVPVVFSHPELERMHKASLQEFWKVVSSRNELADVFLFYTLHSFPLSMELLGSFNPTSHTASIPYFNAGNCLWSLNSKNCATKPSNQ